MFIELHMIQNFAPANLNRDDTGAPKDCEFGGHRRARISSQCLKRSIRTNAVFTQATEVPLGYRTRYLADLFAKAMSPDSDPNQEVKDVALELASEYVKPSSDHPEQGSAMVYVSEDEIDGASQQLLNQWAEITADEKKRKNAIKQIVKGLVKQQKHATSAPDIALFGRMLANKTPRLSFQLHAACQVAHAISTHRVDMEMDYFTAVDDIREERQETGAGHISSTGYNSSCFYRYARIDWKQLVKNLNGDAGMARKTLEGFLRASVAAVPSGKQNSFAANNPPAFLLAVVRSDGMGWSLANAFEKPITPTRERSLSQSSIEALDDYWAKLAKTYGESTLKTVAALQLDDNELSNLGDKLQPSIDEWTSAILTAVDTDVASEQETA